MVDLAPIAVIACRRPVHLRNLLDSLKQNPESEFSILYIFIGGPKNLSDLDLVNETVEVARSVVGFKRVEIFRKPEITSGGKLVRASVDFALKRHDSVIVLEDDLIVRKDFLKYMNASLLQYANNDAVCQISGWNFGKMSKTRDDKTFFFPITTPWGWATWRRAWQTEEQLKVLEDFQWLTSRFIRIHRFNFNENYNALSMIERVVSSDYDAYDAEWYLHCFRHSKLVLYPNSSLVINAGFDGSGLNFKRSFEWKQDFSGISVENFDLPETIKQSKEFRLYIRNFRRWIRTSQGIDSARFLLYIYRRKREQHLKYYKKGYYSLS